MQAVQKVRRYTDSYSFKHARIKLPPSRDAFCCRRVKPTILAMEGDDSLSSDTPVECSDQAVSPVNENIPVVPIAAGTMPEPEPGPIQPINDPAQLIEAIEEQSDSSQNTTLVSGISSTPILPPLAERSQWSFSTRLPANEDANEATTYT